MSRELTGIITAKAGGDDDSAVIQQPFGFMQFMVDCAVILNHSVAHGCVASQSARAAISRFQLRRKCIAVPDRHSGLVVDAAHARIRVDPKVSNERVSSGVEFLRRVKVLHPATIRLVFPEYTNLQTVTDAINEGAIYKFLTNPWDDSHLRANIQMTEANQQLQKLLASTLPSGDTPAE